VLVFGIAKDIMGGASVHLEVELPTDVEGLKQHILDEYPAFEDVRSLAIAINNEYGLSNAIIKNGDEIAIIPPVSGG
ncbi:MAG: MoaD/ThiS family protein, partial [Flavobacteriaceae bacterium]|nr:MoaD/ThiS family protein [Flavobacteriaceae bacterium]